ncbi:MAG: LytTR family transcriptional regulator DNA-binding domain-containing protein [Acidobacteriia bacterium]|nr:LytTR family transcriptional regulator DNA-binding domain-containing protein [Terriglobia bacterium]
MTMRVVIVDDEELARRGIKTRLLRAGDAEIVAECSNAREAIEAIRRTLPDLVFLDVQMPGKTGFDVLEAIGGDAFPRVIFVTAHDRFAIRAFEANALDYLLKPIDDERFEIACQRARESLTRDRDSDFGRRLASVLGTLAPGKPKGHSSGADRLVVRSAGRVVFVKIADLDWVEATGDYVTLHTGKKTWLQRETISEMERKLEPSGFVRIHRSSLVNLDRIGEMRALDNGEYRILLRDGTELKLSRNYRQALERLLDGRS